MKEFTAKTIEDAVSEAAKALGVEETSLIYEVKEEKKSLFKKSATITVYEYSDAVNYAEQYVKSTLLALGVESDTEARIEDGIIKIDIDSDSNPIIIGKNGKTLQALNEITKFAVSTKFKKRFRVLLDAGGYKEDKYDRIARIAVRAAKSVVRTKVDVTLDPMTPDERRVVHNTLTSFEHVRTESSGEGPDRAVTIIYVE